MRRALALFVLLSACGKPPQVDPPLPAWAPGKVFPLARTANARGLTELRGLVHVHSIYSHDACDGAPVDASGTYNARCLEDFRRGACAAGHDFFFLTDHGDSFAENEFPAVLLHDAAQGDVLVERAGAKVANWLACPGGRAALVSAGTETGAMPVGLEAHAAPLAERRATYGRLDDATLDRFAALGAVRLLAHTEDWTVDQLAQLHLDGFEMFNLHRNAVLNAGVGAELLLNHVDPQKFDALPHPDLFLAAFNLEDPVYLSTWGSVLARGVRRVTTFGSDCHQNSFPQLLQDGERIDSYRRMMSAFSNHLLVRTGADGRWDDAALKDALRAGRNFGVFEFLGYAEGFDFHAEEGGAVRELGETAALSAGVVLKAEMPRVQRLDPAGPQPGLTLLLLRARDGGWDEVARTTGPRLEFAATAPGAYRVEVRMSPRHLLPWSGTRKGFFAAERPWVMSSALYVQ
jgi:hypothetical protein